MLYSKFIFGSFKGKSTREKQIHPYRAFVDPLGSTPKSELDWIGKLRMNQARLVTKMEDDKSLHMVALLPRSSAPLTRSSSPLIDDNSHLLWNNLPSLFDLNFSAVCPHTHEPLKQYSFPYYSSFFQAPSQLLRLETRINPFANVRRANFPDYFCHPRDIQLDFYSPEDIKELLYFIPGKNFYS